MTRGPSTVTSILLSTVKAPAHSAESADPVVGMERTIERVNRSGREDNIRND